MTIVARPSTDERFVRLMALTRETACNGYDAVNMRDLAARARVSLQTVYLFVSSKDHLIADAHADSLAAFEASLTSRPLTGDSSCERVVTILRKMCQSLEKNRKLSLAILQALSSLEPAVCRSRELISARARAVLGMGFGDDVADPDGVLDALGYVLDSALQQWARGVLDEKEVEQVMVRTAKLLLEERTT